ncbi:hypothetical protein LBMAG42_53690 [Deltaproteobacteria bacterium]|nr:hypothetical protein LBMAG42_53690 [Deltaproteobacteria bacterium]
MLTLLMIGCNPWDIPVNETTYENALWDPNVAVATDGVYVRLPEAGRLVRVQSDGTWATVDLDGASPESISAAPDGSGVFVVATWPVCDDNDPLVVYVDQCPGSKLTYEREMVFVRDAERVGGGALEGVSAALDSAEWTDDSSIAALYVSPANASSVVVDGFLNLNEVTFVEAATGQVHRVAVGFAAEAVLFTEDNTRALVLSRSQVAMVSLGSGDESCDAWSACVTYKLTLDADTAVTPDDVVLVGDGAYALVSVANSKDLYVLDLENESIDILELAGSPSAVVDDPDHGVTVVAYSGHAQVDVIEHEFFEVSTIELEEPATQAVLTPVGVLAYNDVTSSFKDVAMIDPVSGDWLESRAENPIQDMTVGSRFAVATMLPETSSSGLYDAHYGLGIFTLSAPDSEDVTDPVSLILESAPVGLATLETEAADYALLLMSDVDTLLKVRLNDASPTTLELDAPPLGIAASPDDTFVVMEDSPLGMISFVDPVEDTQATVTGFATVAFVERPVLPRRAAVE